MASVDPFRGPVTALNLTQWLFRCEDSLADWEEDNNKTLTAQRKIKIVGRAISNEEPTKELFDWHNNYMTSFDASTTWDDFRDALKQEALGKGWRLKLLRELYTGTQGNLTVKEYISHWDNLSFVISRIGHGIPKVEAFPEKSHLLFQADPGILDEILGNEIDHQKFVAAKKKDITQWLIKHESAKTGPSSKPSSSGPTPSVPTGIDAVLYMQSPCYGYLSGSRFTDLNSLPLDKVPRVTQFNAWGAFPELSAYKFDLQNPTLTIQPLSTPSGGTTLNFNLGTGEHIATFKLWYSGDFVQRIGFVTSKGVEYTLGGTGSWDRTIEAPSGWSIVGFHGYYDYSNPRYRIKALGCVFARV